MEPFFANSVIGFSHISTFAFKLRLPFRFVPSSLEADFVLGIWMLHLTTCNE